MQGAFESERAAECLQRGLLFSEEYATRRTRALFDIIRRYTAAAADGDGHSPLDFRRMLRTVSILTVFIDAGN